MSVDKRIGGESEREIRYLLLIICFVVMYLGEIYANKEAIYSE